jgi:hypothetical protein
MKRFIHKSVFLFFFAISISTVVAESAREPVYFAGLSFAGDYKDMQSAAPFAAKLIGNDEELLQFNMQLASELEKLDWGDYELKNEKADIKSGDGLTISLSIIEEQYQEEDTGTGEYAISGAVYGQIVVFDFNQKRVISTIPFATNYLHTSKEVSKDTRNEIYRTIYFDKTKGINLINEFTRKFPDINFSKPFNRWNIKVRDVKPFKRVKKTVQINDGDLEHLKTRVANQFSTELSNKFKIPILPYSSGGQALGSMSLCFSDAKVLQLTLPRPNFYIDIKILGLDKEILKETKKRIFISYISAVKVTVGHVNFEEEYFSEMAQTGLVHEVSKKLNINDWNELKNSLTLLTDQYTAQLHTPNKKFLKLNMFSKSSLSSFKKKVKNLEKEVFSKLR